MLSLRTYPVLQIVFMVVFLMPTYTVAWSGTDTERLVEKMRGAFALVNDYQAHLEIRTYSKDGSYTIKKFLYTFKKPNRIRIDFESPYSGMVLVYPDRNGKVVIRPSGWAHFLKIRLSPDSFLLKVSSGQRIDQTDLGLLIRNICDSLTRKRRGQVEGTDDDYQIRVRVLADNHFHEGVVTRYQFFIDKGLWLPVRVEESTPDEILERTLVFEGLRTNIGVPDSPFQMD